MSLSKINPTKTKAWKALLKKKLELDGTKIMDLFDSTNDRLKKFSINFDNLFLDFSKNIIDDKTFSLHTSLAFIFECFFCIFSSFFRFF